MSWEDILSKASELDGVTQDLLFSVFISVLTGRDYLELEEDLISRGVLSYRLFV